jgi:hypothetical protein
MNRMLSAILLIAGLVVLAIGINAANSVSSETSEAFTGAPTDKALWMMLGGGVIALIGLVGMIRKPTAITHG